MTDTSKRIKGIKVNGQVCSLNLSQIGSYVGPDSDEKELTEYIDSKGGGSTQEIESSDGSKFILTVKTSIHAYHCVTLVKEIKMIPCRVDVLSAWLSRIGKICMGKN